MQDVARLALKRSPFAPVHVYTHPSWDMKLMLAADEGSREQALENLGEDADASLLDCELSALSREDFDSLPEWDG